MVKRRLPPHIVLPDGRWRFVKKTHKSARRAVTHRVKRRSKVVRHMARRRYYGRARRFGGGVRRGIGGFSPAISGIADSIIDPISPIDGIGSLAVGYGLHNDFSKSLGMYKAGASVGAMIGISKIFGGVGGSSGGNF